MENQTSPWQFTVEMAAHEEMEINLEETIAASDVENFDSNVNDMIEALSDPSSRVEARHWATVVCYLWGLPQRQQAALNFAEAGIKTLLSQNRQADSVVLFCQLVAYNIALARKAHKMVLEQAKTTAPDGKLKSYYLNNAEGYLQGAQQIDKDHILVKEAALLLAVASTRYEQAANIADKLKQQEADNLMALYAQARFQVSKRQWRAALKSFQSILLSKPTFTPDPRIGIGICYYSLGDKVKAKKAWEVSIYKNPGEHSHGAAICYGILLLNEAREMTRTGNEDAGAATYVKAIEQFQVVLKSNKANAIAAYQLATAFLESENFEAALKLAERAIQFGDTRAVVAEAAYCWGRTLHGLKQYQEALWAYGKAVVEKADLIIAKLASAQLAMSIDVPLARATFHSVLDKQPNCPEAHVGLAVIHSHLSFNALSSAEREEERKRAIEYWEAVVRFFDLAATRSTTMDPILLKRINQIADDADSFVEMARLYANKEQIKALEYYKTSLQIREAHQAQGADSPIPPQLFNNLGCLLFVRKNFEGAKDYFQQALQTTAQASRTGSNGAIMNGVGTDEAKQDAFLTTLSYNLATSLEALGDKEQAIMLYKSRILERHPEFVDAKARLILLHIQNKEYMQADVLLKEALHSTPKSSEVRALYLYYCNKQGNYKELQNFATFTLSSIHATDIYSFCALGMVLYSQAREMRPKEDDVQERKRRSVRFFKSAEFYDKALRIDPKCSFAAMGLAITLAEGSLMTSTLTPQEASAARAKNFRDAVSILTKVKETLVQSSDTDANSSAAVYVNLGHVYASRDDWDKSIESFEFALKRFYNGRNLACFSFLARSWYHKATKDQSFDCVKASLAYARQALELSPKDDSLRFNIALIGHKGIEIMADLPPNRRKLVQIKDAIDIAIEANNIFTHLASVDDKTQTVYPLEMAQQRTKYGAGMLSRFQTDTLAAQEQYEADELRRQEATKEQREAERQRQAELEAARLEEIRAKNAAIAEERRKMQEAAREWMEARKAVDSDEERKKEKRRKKKADNEAATGGNGVEGSGGEGEEADKIKLKRPSKRKNPPAKKQALEGAAEEEEDEAVVKRPKKLVKSAEFVDSEDDE